MSIGLKNQSAASVPTPPNGETSTFIDAADGKLKRKIFGGTVVDIEAGGSLLASAIAFTPSGDIIATNTQDAIEELDAEKANVSHTQAASSITDFDAAADARITAQKGVAGGVASLDGSGRLPSAQLPVAVMSDKGNWSAAANVPALVDGTGTRGDFYIVSTAGTQDLGSGPIPFRVSDAVMYSGTEWRRVGAADAVSSVNGYTGVVALVKADVGLGNVNNVSDANKPVSTAQAAADAAVLASAIQRANHTGTQLAATVSDFDSAALAATSGADAAVLASAIQRANHTGTQLAATISDFNTAARAQALLATLTAISEMYRPINVGDTFEQAINKLLYSGTLVYRTITQDVTVPTEMTWLRANTRITGTAKLRLAGTARVRFL